jgi:serine/threonine-protein kinase
MTFDPLIGAQVGPYRLLGLIGAGGMSRVYVARHQHLGRRAAVKVLAPHLVADSQAVSRFFHEARAAAEAESPNIVEIYDFIWEPRARVAAYVMELLRGRDLRQILQSEPRLALERVVTIAVQVCRALGVLHALGIVHRDIKPENIFLCEPEPPATSLVEGEPVEAPGVDPPLCVKLLDLGIAKYGHPVSHRTLGGAPVGSPWYMSPEQADGRELDGRADLYGLGVVLFEMVTGGVPFGGDKPSEIARRHLEEAPPEIAGPLGPVVARCLAKRPDDRYPTARALERALFALTESAAGNERAVA